MNTVTTYVPWNLHQPRRDPASITFDGMLDIVRFIRLAKQAGLLVIVRPPPYICAEFEFGGMPAWLLKDDVVLRSRDPKFVEPMRVFLDIFLPLIRPCVLGLFVWCGV